MMEAHPKSIEQWGKVAVLTAAVILSTASPAFADEYGRETETDTLFTGETSMVRRKLDTVEDA